MAKKKQHRTRVAKAPQVRSETDTTTSTTVAPPPRPPVTAVSPREAMTMASVFRSFQILATAVSQLSIGVWRQDVEIDAPNLVRNPDVLGEHRSAFLESTTTSLAATGNAYWRLWRAAYDPVSPVISCELLSPHETIAVESTTRPGRVDHYQWRDQRLEPWQVQHLKLLRIPGQVHGLGPIQAASRDLRGGLDVRDYATGWFQTSGMPSGVLKTDQKLGPDEAKDYRTDWQSTPAGQVRVLGQGLDFVPFLLKPADAQWLENQRFTVTQVARMFGIPATYLLAAIDGTAMTYQNMEQVDIALVRYTLMAYLREIEEAFTAIIARGQTARFKVDALLRTDTKTRMETYEIGLRAGIYDLAWVQRTEGLPMTPAPAAQETLNA